MAIRSLSITYLQTGVQADRLCRHHPSSADSPLPPYSSQSIWKATAGLNGVISHHQKGFQTRAKALDSLLYKLKATLCVKQTLR